MKKAAYILLILGIIFWVGLAVYVVVDSYIAVGEIANSAGENGAEQGGAAGAIAGAFGGALVGALLFVIALIFAALCLIPIIIHIVALFRLRKVRHKPVKLGIMLFVFNIPASIVLFCLNEKRLGVKNFNEDYR